tara:strand:+ start:5596 stop:6504 length:909 start_codon:yes stop_codon:yes gene_type:complete
MMNLNSTWLAGTLAWTIAGSCTSTHTIHVVDEHGALIEGVLVLSGIRQGVANPCIVASMTSEAGEGTAVEGKGVALFRDGYHPIIHSLDQPYAYMDAPWGLEPGPLVLWELRDAEPRVVNVEEVDVLRPTSAGHRVELEPPSGLELEVLYHPSSGFQVTALAGSLIPSDRFYFAGPSRADSQTELEGRSTLAFYVLSQDGEPRFKVGLVDHHFMWVGLGARRTNVIRWLWTEVDDLETPVVLKLTDEEHELHVGRIVDPRPGPSFELDGDPDRVRAAMETHLTPLGIPERLQGWLERVHRAR